MAEKNPTPDADISDEAADAQEVATALEVPGEAAATSEAGAEAGAEVVTPQVATTTKAAAPAKATGPAKAAKSTTPAKAAAAKAATSAKSAPKAPKAPARRTAGTPVDAGAPEPRTGRRKVREGIVISNSMEKTAVVAIIERVRHPRYAKTVQRTKRLYAHDEANDTRVGDRVRLSETRPLSKLKRWRVDQVLERAR
jgi:small subunit ribosomal protein S17